MLPVVASREKVRVGDGAPTAAWVPNDRAVGDHPVPAPQSRSTRRAPSGYHTDGIANVRFGTGLSAAPAIASAGVWSKSRTSSTFTPRRGVQIVYPLTDESWGVRRFFVEEPNGLVVNVMEHRGSVSRRDE